MAGKTATLAVRFYNVRVAWIEKLWKPDTEYKGQQQQKPTYSVQGMVPKTTHLWHQEPAFRDFVTSCMQFFQMAYSGIPFEAVQWPIQDGDMPSREGKMREWAKGHWLIPTNSTNQPRIEGIVDGAVVPVPAQMLGGRKIWDDGDYAILDLALAQNQNDRMKVKLFVNTVCFCGKGEHLPIGFQRVSGDELLAEARSRGMNPTGINGQQFAAPGPGAFAPPAGGFGQAGFAPQQQQQQQQQAFAPAAPAGFAPQQPPQQAPAFAGAFTPVPGAAAAQPVQQYQQPNGFGPGGPAQAAPAGFAPAGFQQPAPAAPTQQTGFAGAPAAQAPSGFNPATAAPAGFAAPSPSNFGQPGGWTPPQQ